MLKKFPDGAIINRLMNIENTKNNNDKLVLFLVKTEKKEDLIKKNKEKKKIKIIGKVPMRPVSTRSWI